MTTFARPSTPFPHAHSLFYTSSSASASYFSPMPTIAPIAEASSSSSSAFASSSRRFSQPLHFTLPALPTRTPPSLLKRSASSSSSSSNTAEERDVKFARAYSPVITPSTPLPALVERRTSSSSSSSSDSESSVSPATPPRGVHLALPRQSSSPYFLSAQKAAAQAPAQIRHQPTYAAWPEFESLDDTPLTAVELLTDDAYDLAVSQAQDFYSSTSAPYPSPLTVQVPQPLHAQSNAKRASSPTRPKFKRRDTPRPVETISSLASISLKYEGRKGLVQIEEQGARRFTSVVDGRQWVVVA